MQANGNQSNRKIMSSKQNRAKSNNLTSQNSPTSANFFVNQNNRMHSRKDGISQQHMKQQKVNSGFFYQQPNNGMTQQQQLNHAVPYQQNNYQPNIITQVHQNQATNQLSESQKQQLQGFQRFGKEAVPSHLAALGEQKPHAKGKKTLLLDLDETLVHSSFKPTQKPDIVLPLEIEGNICNVYVLIRPGTEFFLQRLAKCYELVIYTASLSKYADPLIDILDSQQEKVIDYRMFREHCTFFNGVFIKDMALPGRDLTGCFIIDNSPTSYAFHQENALPILSWYDDPNDRCLFEMIPLLEALAEVDDVRKYIPRFVTTDHRIDFLRASQLLAGPTVIQQNKNSPLQQSNKYNNQVQNKQNVGEKQTKQNPQGQSQNENSSQIINTENEIQGGRKNKKASNSQLNQGLVVKTGQNGAIGTADNSGVLLREESGSVINNDELVAGNSYQENTEEKVQPILMNNSWTLEGEDSDSEKKVQNNKRSKLNQELQNEKTDNEQQNVSRQITKHRNSRSFHHQNPVSNKNLQNDQVQQQQQDKIVASWSQLNQQRNNLQNVQSQYQSQQQQQQQQIAVHHQNQAQKNRQQQHDLVGYHSQQRPTTRDSQRRAGPQTALNSQALQKSMQMKQRKLNNYNSRSNGLQMLLQPNRSFKQSDTESSTRINTGSKPYQAQESTNNSYAQLQKNSSEKYQLPQPLRESNSMQRQLQNNNQATPPSSNNYLQRFFPNNGISSNQNNSEVPSARQQKEFQGQGINMGHNIIAHKFSLAARQRKNRRPNDLNDTQHIISTSHQNLDNIQSEIEVYKARNLQMTGLVKKRSKHGGGGSRQKLIMGNMSQQRVAESQDLMVMNRSREYSQRVNDPDGGNTNRPLSAKKPALLMNNFQPINSAAILNNNTSKAHTGQRYANF